MITPDQSALLLAQLEGLMTDIESTASTATIHAIETIKSLYDEFAQLGQTRVEALQALLASITEKPSPVPLSYAAITDRVARPKSVLAVLGPAGSSYVDGAFGKRITRMTDVNSVLSIPGRSFRTPSSVHARAWNADSTMFYVVSTHGNIIPFVLDRASMQAKRFGDELMRLTGEPNFHPTLPYQIIGGTNSATNYQIVAYDLWNGITIQLLDLKPLVSFDLTSPRTYIGDTGISADGKRVFAFFGGTGQDKHQTVAVKDLGSGKVWVLDTMKGTINGQPISALPPMGFHIHAASMDRSGRYLKLTWASGDTNLPGPYWDIDNGTFSTSSVSTGGHDAYGYGVRINQSGDGPYPYDAAQWQLRKLDSLGTPRPLISPILTPKEVYLADHPSWHNAQPDRLVPFLSGLYRYGGPSFSQSTYPWRAWDDEIVAVQTDVPADAGATVWRFCHHRSDVSWSPLAGGSDATRNYFWAYPRPQISPDGKLALFTSNMEKTLGDDPKGEDGGKKRQDVFLVELV